jgi:RNA polymerase sigma factor (sigma-70 family)
MGMDSDRELWSRSLRGDGDAFAVLFDRHERRVYRAVLRSANDSGGAEDLVASVFLELWRRRGAVHLVDDSLAPWLLVTAGNICRNANRSLRRYRAMIEKLPAPENVRPIDEQLVDREVVDALRRLPRHDAEILALVAVDGLPLVAAAEALGISAATARARLSRARRRYSTTFPTIGRALPTEGSSL